MKFTIFTVFTFSRFHGSHFHVFTLLMGVQSVSLQSQTIVVCEILLYLVSPTAGLVVL